MNTAAPNYDGLLKLLPRLKRFPDAIGETTLTPAEAVEIRVLGFRAGPGKWIIPFIPFEFVRDTVFEWAAQQRPAIPIEDSQVERVDQDLGRQERAETTACLTPEFTAHSSEPCKGTTKPVEHENRSDREAEAVILQVVESHSGRIAKRRLQQGAHRLGATRFNQTLKGLLDRGVVRMEGNKVVLVTVASC